MLCINKNTLRIIVNTNKKYSGLFVCLCKNLWIIKRSTIKKEKSIDPRVNERIRIPKIRVINEDGKMLGIMSPQEALSIAKKSWS